MTVGAALRRASTVALVAVGTDTAPERPPGRVAPAVAAPSAERGATSDWEPARPDYRWAFPRDHWAHPAYRTEWWYLTGHLRVAGDTAPRFGYQVTIFRVGVVPRPPALASDWATAALVMGHAALTDLATGRHRFSETLYRATPLLGGFGAPGDSVIAWSRAPAGTPGRWTLRRTGEGFGFSAHDRAHDFGLALSVRPRKPLVLQGPNGLSRKGPGATQASLYYSYPRLDTRGHVLLDGREVAVTGTSWMDQEIGSDQLATDQVGWDWFSLQLDDGRDLMLYLLRDSTGATSWASGTLISPSGSPRWLDTAAFDVAVRDRWRSPASGATYPARWTVTVPEADLRLDVTPLLADQENRSRLVRGLFYWEGAVRVAGAGGRPAGRGYVELVGYGRGLRLGL